MFWWCYDPSLWIENSKRPSNLLEVGVVPITHLAFPCWITIDILYLDFYVFPQCLKCPICQRRKRDVEEGKIPRNYTKVSCIVLLSFFCMDLIELTNCLSDLKFHGIKLVSRKWSSMISRLFWGNSPISHFLTLSHLSSSLPGYFSLLPF